MSIDKTRMFNLNEINQLNINTVLKEVVNALNEKGYNATNQIVGYLISGDPAYISNHKDARNKILCLERVFLFIDQYKCDTVVIGLPLHMNGDLSTHAKICQDFGKKLKDIKDVKIVMIDERMTSMQANKILLSADLSRKKRKKVIDKIAAVIILQSYLDANY